MKGTANVENYLDWASAAPVSKGAERAYVKVLEVFGNPSSPHAEGNRARALLEEARVAIARLAAVKADCVIFTSGATEANALAIQGHINALVSEKKLSELHTLYLPTVHSSVVDTMTALGERGMQIEKMKLTDGVVDLIALKKQLRPETVLVSMDVVCGETGTLFNTRDVRRVIDAHNKSRTSAPKSVGEGSTLDSGGAISEFRTLLHLDASQAPFSESIDHNHLGADLMTLDAQKVGRVRGTGALIRANALIPLEAIMQGGGQEQGLRPGTENVAGAVAFATALGEVCDVKNRDEFKKRASEARAQLLSTLISAFPDMLINSGNFKSGPEFKDTNSVPHILNVSFPGRDTDYAVMLLSNAGFMVSTKSACETDETGSRVVLEFTKDTDASASFARALATLRISWGPTTRTRILQKFAKELIATIQFLDSHKL